MTDGPMTDGRNPNGASSPRGAVRTGRGAPRIPGLAPRITLARLALFWEALWRALWPAAAVLGLFLAVAFLDLLPGLPALLHGAVLLGFLAGFGFLLWGGLRGMRLPDRSAGRRRLETASGLSHRPLSALEDSLATGHGDAATEQVWQIHRRRMAALASRLRVGVPSPGVAGQDPWGLRAIAVLLLVIGVGVAGNQGGDRLLRAMAPQFPVAGAAAPTLDLWITPPPYTRIAPLFLDPASDGALDVPAGSKLTAHVNGGRETPTVTVGETETALKKIGPENYQTEFALDSGDSLAIEQGGETLGAWPMNVIADAAPNVIFANPPAETERHHLHVDYAAEDDYGIEQLALEIRLRARQGDEPMVIDLRRTAEDPRSIEQTLFRDLTPHPWAGLEATLVLRARDARDQTGTSETVTMTLPERPFTHPVAIDIIRARRMLTLVPDERAVTVEALDAILEQPERFGDASGIYLSLRTARERLNADGSEAVVAEVQELLWETALRLEEGDLSAAERELQAAREALSEAMERNAPPEEIQKAIERLQQALDRYMQALAEEMNRQDAEAEMPEFDPNDMASLDLQRLLEQIRKLAESGQFDAAQQMLQSMERMLENMRAGRMSSEQAQRMQQGQKIMKGLGDLIERQTDLLDRTFQLNQQQQALGDRQGQAPQGQMPPDRPMGEMQVPGQSAQGESAQGESAQGESPEAQGQQGQQGQGQRSAGMQARTLEAIQRALRQALGEMMGQLGEYLGEVPQTMGQAEQAMRRAAEALAENRTGDAMPPETEAIEKLQEGAQAAMQQMAQQFGMMMGMGPGMPPGTQVDEEGLGGEFRDPLGRGRGNGMFGSLDGRDVKVPDEMELQRARDILDELRKRSGERNRPEDELDYIDRLLERF
ncbi:MAG: TIGR02302 family protein [Acetobacterales bacterium]